MEHAGQRLYSDGVRYQEWLPSRTPPHSEAKRLRPQHQHLERDVGYRLEARQLVERRCGRLANSFGPSDMPTADLIARVKPKTSRWMVKR
jgi:hypothetical protein